MAEQHEPDCVRRLRDLTRAEALAGEVDRAALVATAREVLVEFDRLRRQMETMPPWKVSEAPTDAELRALRLRWAFGPERYQSDADALIAAVLRGREALAAVRDALRDALPDALPDPAGSYAADGADLVTLVKLLDARHRAAVAELHATPRGDSDAP